MYFPFRYCLLTLYVVLVVYLQVQNTFSLALVSLARRTEVLVVYLQVFRLSAAASIGYEPCSPIEAEAHRLPSEEAGHIGHGSHTFLFHSIL